MFELEVKENHMIYQMHENNSTLSCLRTASSITSQGVERGPKWDFYQFRTIYNNQASHTKRCMTKSKAWGLRIEHSIHTGSLTLRSMCSKFLKQWVRFSIPMIDCGSTGSVMTIEDGSIKKLAIGWIANHKSANRLQILTRYKC